MQEGQYRFRGITFGGIGDNIIIEDADHGDGGLNVLSAPNPLGHGSQIGRNRYAGSPVTFNLVTVCDNSTEAFAAMRALGAKWHQLDDSGNIYDWLYFNAGGRELKVYGKPGRFPSGKPDYTAKQGVVRTVAEFVVSDPKVYLASTIEHNFSLSPVGHTDSVEYVEAVSNRYVQVENAPDINRAGSISFTNDGTAPGPVIVTITGAIDYPTIVINDTLVTLETSTASASATLALNTQSRVIRKNGDILRNRLIGFSRLDGALKPGINTIFVAGTDNDPGSNITVNVSYSPADWTL